LHGCDEQENNWLRAEMGQYGREIQELRVLLQRALEQRARLVLAQPV